MGDEVRVSEQGVRQLVSAAHEQYLNLSEASGFTCQAGLADTGAFSGFLGVFRSDYEAAYGALTEALDSAMTGTRELSRRMDHALSDILATETRVERDLDRIRTAVTAAEEVTLPTASDAVPGVPTPVGHLNAIADVPWHMEGPQPPSWAGEASTGAPISLVGETTGMINNASDTGAALSTDDDIDDFLEEHDQ
ncbi:hypothetical protein [Nocardioides dokdonensis]|nr:hypothetical protein [Nocardioides dokdonensis]